MPRTFHVYGQIPDPDSNPHLQLVEFKEQILTSFQLAKRMQDRLVYLETGPCGNFIDGGLTNEQVQHFATHFPYAEQMRRNGWVALKVGDSVVVQLEDGTYKVYTAIAIRQRISI